MSRLDARRVDGLKLFENLEKFISINAPMFYPQFAKYGVAKWVWSTVWQEALASHTYKEFCARVGKYSPQKHIRKLFDYKNLLVRLSSILFIYSKSIYFVLIRMYRRKYRKLS